MVFASTKLVVYLYQVKGWLEFSKVSLQVAQPLTNVVYLSRWWWILFFFFFGFSSTRDVELLKKKNIVGLFVPTLFKGKTSKVSLEYSCNDVFYFE